MAVMSAVGGVGVGRRSERRSEGRSVRTYSTGTYSALLDDRTNELNIESQNKRKTTTYR